MNVTTSITTTTNISLLSNLVGILNLYYPISLSLIATIGNILSLLVFSSKIFKNNASGFYLRIKAFADILNVYIGTLRYVYIATTNGTDIKDTSSFMCIFVSIWVYTIDPFDSWLSVFTSLDRLVLVLKPSYYKSISNKTIRHFQILIVLVTFTLILIINVMKIFFMSFVVTESFNGVTNQTLVSKKCSFTNSNLIDLVNLALTLIVPFAIMTASSSIMGYNLIKSKSKINKNKNKSGYWTKNIAFIKTIVCLDICFLVFNLPRFILQLVRGSSALYTFVLQLSTIFKYSYYSLTVLFYLMTNNLFRGVLAETCCTVLAKSKVLAYKKSTKVRPVDSVTAAEIL